MSRLYVYLIIINLVLLPSTEVCAQNQKQYYLLKEYVLHSAEQEARTDTFLKESYLPALKNLGVSPVGVFKTRAEAKDSLWQTYVLVPLKSLSQLALVEDLIITDKQMLKKGELFLSAAYDNPPFVRIRSTVLRAFEDMPLMVASPLKGPRSKRVYELRSYQSGTESLYRNKVAMFNEGGEIDLFHKLGFNAVFYGEVLVGDEQPNLMYMTTFDDMETRDKLWEKFFSSEKWEELKSDPKYQHNVSRADIMLLYPAEYSDY